MCIKPLKVRDTNLFRGKPNTKLSSSLKLKSLQIIKPSLNPALINLIDISLWLAEPIQQQPISPIALSHIQREKEEHVTTDQPFVKARVTR